MLDEIFTAAGKRNDLLFQLGDVLELFAGVKGHPAYVEYHFVSGGVRHGSLTLSEFVSRSGQGS